MGEPHKPSDTAPSEDVKAIEAIVAGMDNAWNRGDAKAFSERFAAEGLFVNALGAIFEERRAFEERSAEVFRGFGRGTTSKGRIRKLRFIRPDVAIAAVVTETSGYTVLPATLIGTSGGVLRGETQLVVVREKGEWWIVGFHWATVLPSMLPPEMIV
jgi:uncharacterized protein (TIGR02246 family)